MGLGGWLRGLAVVALLTPLAFPAPATANPTGSPAPDFYSVPDPLPVAAPGTLLKWEPATEPSSLTVSADVFRVMYHSRSVQGADIVVTGTIAVPQTAAPAGGRLVVTMGHGTTGNADGCAPSKTSYIEPPPVASALLARGDVVAQTDYEGLGTPGRHPHLVGISEARGMIDIVRAARQLPAAHAGTRYAAFGFSEGGHAGLWVGQEADWAPELQLVSVAVAAPGSQLVLAYPFLIDHDRLDLVLTAAGFNAAYPTADLNLVFAPKGLARLPIIDDDNVCYHAVEEAFADLTDAELSKGDPAKVPAWRALLVANEPGTVRTPYPTIIIQGTDDQVVPPVATDLLYQRMCGLGQDVELRKIPGTHLASWDYAEQIATWIHQHFDGTAPATPPCPAAPPSTTTTSTTTPTTGGTSDPVSTVPAGRTPIAIPIQRSPSFTG